MLEISRDKRQKLQDAQKREEFVREADEVAAWISDRKAVASSDEVGKDLEYVEMLQKNFDDFLKVGSLIYYRARFTTMKLSSPRTC